MPLTVEDEQVARGVQAEAPHALVGAPDQVPSFLRQRRLVLGKIDSAADDPVPGGEAARMGELLHRLARAGARKQIAVAGLLGGFQLLKEGADHRPAPGVLQVADVAAHQVGVGVGQSQPLTVDDPDIVAMAEA